jgi:hypothetical protein
VILPKWRWDNFVKNDFENPSQKDGFFLLDTWQIKNKVLSL